MQISAQLVKELRQRSGAGMMECKKALVANDGSVEAAMEWLRKQGLAKADKKAGRVAAEGRIVSAQDARHAVLVEVNCETDFVAKDENFIKFSAEAAAAALKSNVGDVEALKTAETASGSNIEQTRQGLVSKLGENIQVRRVVKVEAEADGLIGHYVHGNRIGVLVALKGGTAELAKGVAMHVAAMNPQYLTAADVPSAIVDKEKDIAQGQLSAKDKTKPAAIIDKILSGKVHKVIAEQTLVGQAYVLDTSVTVGEALKKAGAEVENVVRLAVGEGIEKQADDFHAEVMKQAGLA